MIDNNDERDKNITPGWNSTLKKFPFSFWYMYNVKLDDIPHIFFFKRSKFSEMYVSSFDFSTLWTSLPQDLIKSKVLFLVKWRFKR